MIVLQIILVMVLGLVIAGLFAPGEALSWWQRNYVHLDSSPDAPIIDWPRLEQAKQAPLEQEIELPAEVADNVARPKPVVAEDGDEHYLVYLSGIGTSGPDQLPVFEVPVVDELAKRLGKTTVIWDIYPYSVENQALTTGRRFSGLWQRLRIWKFEKKPGRFLAVMINVRNAFQMLVSSDRRYGPVFNLAVAEQISAALLRHGYKPEEKKPVTLLGWSGGAQIALGATWYLSALGVPVRVISMAGITSSDPGIDRAVKIWHLRGHKDNVTKAGLLLFPRRWRIFKNTSWNRAIRDGRIQLVDLGALTHTGEFGYYSAKTTLPDGRQPRQASIDHIVKVLVDEGLATDTDGKF